MDRLLLHQYGRWFVLTSVFLLIIACTVGGIGSSGDTPPTDDFLESSTTQTPAVLPQNNVEPEPPDPPEQAACPDGPASFGLQAVHHFWTDTGMGDWVWQAQGFLQVVLDEQGKVTNTSTQIIPGSQSGEFASGQNHCAFEAPAEVIITIDGSCTEGVLSLEIWEDWKMGTYDWVCDDDSFQFELPIMGMPPSVHQVEYALGNDPSYTFEIPFGGGSGTKVYTLVP